MSKVIQFIPKNCTHYSIDISQDSFGVAKFWVKNVEDTDKDRLSIAFALREIANQLEKSVGQRSAD